MRRETRLNLIFLTLFLAVSLPGAVILVKKKLQPGARDFSLPDHVRQTISYTSPDIVPERIKRVVPPGLNEWKQSIVPEATKIRFVPAQSPDALGLPAVSEDRSFEVLGIAPVETHLTGEVLYLLIWAKDLAEDAKNFRVAVSRTDEGALAETPLAPSSVAAVEIPSPQRRKLIDFGHVDPPKSIVFMRFELPSALPRKFELPSALPRNTPLRVSLAHANGSGPARSARVEIRSQSASLIMKKE
jgi:hypothetical protein